MAPDINSLPPSPRQHRQQLSASPRTSMSNPPSRRASQQMPPPPVPISNQTAQRSPRTSTSEQFEGEPLRHPRPMTAAELFAECEKEQEAVVSQNFTCICIPSHEQLLTDRCCIGQSPLPRTNSSSRPICLSSFQCFSLFHFYLCLSPTRRYLRPESYTPANGCNTSNAEKKKRQ